MILRKDRPDGAKGRRARSCKAVRLQVAAILVFGILAAAGTTSAKPETARWEARCDGIEEPYFSIVWLTDTQTMTEHPKLYPALKSMFRWIIFSREQCRTICVIHTGDLVEYGGNEDYWAMITPLIEEVSEFLPFLAVAGNHDLDHEDYDWSFFLSQPFMTERPGSELYDQGKGGYVLMHACGIDVLAVGLGYDVTGDEAIAWAKGVFDDHPDAVGVFVTHSYLSYATSLTSTYTKNGEAFRDLLVASCPSIRFVLSGHVSGTGYITEQYDDDGDGLEERTVHVLRYNYQESTSLRRAGFLRILTVFPGSDRLKVYTYSPYLDLEVYDYRFAREETFEIYGLAQAK